MDCNSLSGWASSQYLPREFWTIYLTIHLGVNNWVTAGISEVLYFFFAFINSSFFSKMHNSFWMNDHKSSQQIHHRPSGDYQNILAVLPVFWCLRSCKEQGISLHRSFSYFSCIVLSFDFPFILLILLTVYHFHDKLLISSAAVAQEVAHLIGSEEVTGSTPVSSFIKKT